MLARVLLAGPRSDIRHEFRGGIGTRSRFCGNAAPRGLAQPAGSATTGWL